MCGIAGQIDFGAGPDEGVVRRMCDALVHRGPDAFGAFRSGPAMLGMRRLAIIDIVGGNQPIYNEDRSVAVVMNGEIYNYRELRETLLSHGHRLASSSDTEVLVHLYEDYGDDLVHQLRGMFAFALWDSRRERLLLARDRVGKKPLYVARQGSKLAFASEITALLRDPRISREVSPEAIRSYLAYQYVPHPQTAFTSIRKLPPATVATFAADGMSERRYWAAPHGTPCAGSSRPEELAEELRAAVWEATRVRLVSEVPLGAFLSGGLDSSIVVAAMADQTAEPVKTFSIGFTDTAYDELTHARSIAERFSTDHHEFVVEPDALEIMPKLARHFGEPFADPAAIPTFYLAQMTAGHVTVAMNGDGGDESFAGYERYVHMNRLDSADRLPRAAWRAAGRVIGPPRYPSGRSTAAERARRAVLALAMSPGQRYANWMSAFRRSDEWMLQPQFVSEAAAWPGNDPVRCAWGASHAERLTDRMLDTDIHTYLPDDLLTKVDIAAMAYSVEGRSPLLDQKVMEFAARVPAELKLAGTTTKALLKRAVSDVLPNEILERPKMGFGVPLGRWFREELRAVPSEMLLASDARVHRYVHPDAIARMIAEHQNSTTDHALRLWTLLQLETWHREVVEVRDPFVPEARPARAAVPGER